MKVYKADIFASSDGSIRESMEIGDAVEIAGQAYVSRFGGQLLVTRDDSWFHDIGVARLAGAARIEGIARRSLELAERIRKEVADA